MSKSSEAVKVWRKETKKRIIESMGGGCVCCGYNKCNRSLSLHHLDPKEKEFGISSIMANIRSWRKIVPELRKCVLVCSNCHYEIHEGITTIPNGCGAFNEEYENYKLLNYEKSICPVCQEEKPKWNKTCSRSCSAKISKKVDWENINLHKLIIEEKRSLRSIGKDLGVSDNAVRKRAKKLGIIK